MSIFPAPGFPREFRWEQARSRSELTETVPRILAGIEKLGFHARDVKILTTTHGHFDHVAGLAELKRRTGAKVVISAPDAALLESGGKADFRFGDDADARCEPVKVDRLLRDGDTIKLGGIVLTSHLHPGHTRGATSFTFDVQEAGRTYRTGIMNMASVNPGVHLDGIPGFPDIAAAYEKTFRAQKEIELDIFLASHAAQFNLRGKYHDADSCDPNRFLDPAAYQNAVARMERAYLAARNCKLGLLPRRPYYPRYPGFQRRLSTRGSRT